MTHQVDPALLKAFGFKYLKVHPFQAVVSNVNLHPYIKDLLVETKGKDAVRHDVKTTDEGEVYVTDLNLKSVTNKGEVQAVFQHGGGGGASLTLA